MIGQRPLIFWIALSMGLHAAALTLCPVPDSFHPPRPVYLVVDLFSGSANSGSGHGLDANPGGGSKPTPSKIASPAGPLKKPQQTVSAPAVEWASEEIPNPPAPKQAHIEKTTAPTKSATDEVSPEPPLEASAGEKIKTTPVVAVSTGPLTDNQEKFDQGQAIDDGNDNGPGAASGVETGSGSGSGSGQGGQAGSGSPVETPFAYGSNPPPPYPSTARRRGWEGEVLLLVEVTAAGEVCKITVRRSSGYQILDRTALNAVYRWKFQAALRNGRAVAGKVLVPIRFSIKDAK